MRSVPRTEPLRISLARPTARWLMPLAAAASLVITLLDTAPASAFLCCCRPPTLREDLASHDAVVFCRLIAEPDPGDGNRALFEVTEILKDAELLPKPRPGASVPHRFRAAMTLEGAGVEYLVFASLNEQGTALEWRSVEPVNDREMAYARGLAALPSLSEEAESSTPPSRLKRLLPFLDATDPLIVWDLREELATIPYPEILAARDELPAARLRQWIADPTTSGSRLGYYLLLLSACGTKDDLPLVRNVLKSTDSQLYAAQYSGIACFVLLGGEESLAEIESMYFKPRKTAGDSDADLSRDRYCALIGLVTASQNTKTISRNRLVATFRLALDLPEYADTAANELARLEDWESTPRLMEIFRAYARQSERDHVRYSIVNFIRLSPLDDADQCLAELRELDPESVAAAMKYYPIRKQRTALMIVSRP